MRLLHTGVCLAVCVAAAMAQPHHWSPEEANSWYARQPWPMGANFIPSVAASPIEMWQPETFNSGMIERELGIAESVGMNSVRVFLNYLVWQRDPAGHQKRMNAFLRIADRHQIRTIFVLFDSCWDPFPELGPQRPPLPGIHNSRWGQSPGMKALYDDKHVNQLMDYVHDVIFAFAKDKRVLAWDLWNEPDNTNQGSYGTSEAADKVQRVTALMPRVFEFARASMPDQPLTCGLWQGDWSSPDKLTPIEKIQIENSDVISFHNYGKAEEFEQRVGWLQAYHRPILLTEYMARPVGSTLQAILPLAKKAKVGAFNWGLVAGKTQTYLPWDSWQHPYTDRQPNVWFHDLFRGNGQPYSTGEMEFLKSIAPPPAR